jgi:glycogen debranching enzyme
VFDAEAPFTPRGCIAQAWSVAEFLRSWIKLDMVRLKPDTTETRMTDTRAPEGVTVSR